jgi:hypothetical protein
MFHSPSEHGVDQCFTFRVEISKFQQRDNTLGDTVNVDRVSAVMKVTGCTVSAEKVGAIEFKPAPDT